MSHAVVRGNPTRSQLYLDGILDSVIRDGCTGATTRDRVNLAEILYYCLRIHSSAIHSINAATGENFTNEQILKRAVSIARALTALSARETVVLMVRNHEHMSALFYATLFAGVVPFMMEPGSTEYEIQQFLPLISPRLIFCERDRRDDVTIAVRSCDVRADVVVADGPSLDKFVEGYSEDFESYKLPDMAVDSTAFILPTSGSTGVPKAAMLTHQGMLMQIPSSWLHDWQFPHPTSLVLLLSTAQWLTHTISMNTCPVYQVPILMSPVKITAEHFVDIAEKYRPTWAILGPSLAARVGNVATPEQLSSFESLYIGGSPFTSETVAALKVLTSLHLLGDGSYQRGTGQDHGLSIAQSTVSHYLGQFVDAVNRRLMRKWIIFPGNERSRRSTANAFQEAYGLPHILGAIDCTQVKIFPPPLPHSVQYLNRKGVHSLNVQLIADVECRIIAVNARFPGRVHDSFIFNNSRVKQELKRLYDAHIGEYYLLGRYQIWMRWERATSSWALLRIGSICAIHKTDGYFG